MLREDRSAVLHAVLAAPCDCRPLGDRQSRCNGGTARFLLTLLLAGPRPLNCNLGYRFSHLTSCIREMAPYLFIARHGYNSKAGMPLAAAALHHRSILGRVISAHLGSEHSWFKDLFTRSSGLSLLLWYCDVASIIWVAIPQEQKNAADISSI